MRELFNTAWKGRKPLLRVLLVLALAIIVRRWIWSPVVISGNSMSPALHTGEIVGVNKLIYVFQSPQRGEVVAFWTGKELMIKRVIGLPGEDVEMRDGVFYVNGLPLPEAYVRFQERGNIAQGRLEPNQFVVAGDNRPQSLIAVVKRDRIVGRLIHQGRSLHSDAISKSLPKIGAAVISDVEPISMRGITCAFGYPLPNPAHRDAGPS